MPRTTEHGLDRFADTLLYQRLHTAFNALFLVPCVVPFAHAIEITEIGISVGAITGGTNPGCTLALYNLGDVLTAGVMNTSKGSVFYDGTAAVCTANKSLVKVFKPDELVMNHTSGGTTDFNNLFSANANPKYGLAMHMRVGVSGTPTSIASAYAWIRVRPYWEG